MRAAPALLVALWAAGGHAATAYVTDELVLGVYAAPSAQGPRLATLHSGAAVDTLAVSGDATQVRLVDGIVGWVKSAYLVTSAPATVRVKQLQDELDRNHATTPELAEAAERSEVERLTHELATAQAAAGASSASGAPSPVAAAGSAAPGTRPHLGWWAGSILAAAGAGFWLGYAALARRIRHQFGGIKVY